MGFFSFKTADTQKSIKSADDCDLYLLHPSGDHIRVKYYEGFGRFTSFDNKVISVFNWLVMTNVTPVVFHSLDEQAISNIGIAYSDGCGKYFEDPEGFAYLCDMHWESRALRVLLIGRKVCKFSDFDTELSLSDGKRGTVNSFIEHKCLSTHYVIAKYPLKISEKLCHYEDVVESVSCPDEGCF